MCSYNFLTAFPTVFARPIPAARASGAAVHSSAGPRSVRRAFERVLNAFRTPGSVWRSLIGPNRLLKGVRRSLISLRQRTRSERVRTPNAHPDSISLARRVLLIVYHSYPLISILMINK